ncbi:hypothetical protein AC628_22940 [Bradyrhizobium sp. NAS96.2]|nr:hypothetical protein AC628_22940 [Bradyrhizobium sp. NAS96.2]
MCEKRHRSPSSDWPRNSDGDVLRSMAKRGFDFSLPHEIDFNIDFQAWPPPAEAIQLLRSKCQDVKIYDEGQYVQLRINAHVTYEFVIRTQADFSEQMKAFGGVCESWGVFYMPFKPEA